MADIFEYAANTYGFNKNTLKFITDSTNKIYSFERNNKQYILRVTQKPAEAIGYTKAEIEWLYYLSENGIDVSMPLYTKDNELVTSAVDANGQNYILSAYEKAAGVFWDKNNPELWNNEIFYNWGLAMGAIHRLTKDYAPPDDKYKRDEFKGNFALADSYRQNSDVKETAEKIIKEIMNLPKDKDSYGLIHNDFHPWNFHIDGKTIRVFDFDDCLYGWFSMDIGIALYHGLWWGRPSVNAQVFCKEFIQSFLKGYISQNKLDNFWLDKIILFMRYRQICAFSWFFNPNNINEDQNKMIYNIKNNILFDDCNPEQIYFRID